MNKVKPQGRAFTLIEVLVVMAMIGILAALLLTAVGHVKSRVSAISCLYNLKQWGTAAHLYALDNDDLLPKDGSPNGASVNEGWYIDLPRVLNLPTYHQMPWRTNASIDPGRSIWICPANPRRSSGSMLFHYCLNGLLDGAGNTDSRVKLGDLPKPSTIIYLFDSKNQPAVHADKNNPGSFVHTNLHNQGAQFVFLDGHAARFKNTVYWNFKTGKGISTNLELVWSP